MAKDKKARKGILGTKLGMTQVFDENNRVVPVTVVRAGPNVVTRIRTPEDRRIQRGATCLRRDQPAQSDQTGHWSVTGCRGESQGRYLAELRASRIPKPPPSMRWARN